MSMDADLILTNGVVYTVDAGRSRHEALAVRDGRIAAVGSAAEVAALRGPRTTVVDLAGRLLLPGFIDAHMHPKYATGELFEVFLGGCRSMAECLAEVGRFAAAHPAYAAVRGWGWTPTTVPEREMTAAALDGVEPDRPVVLADDSVHTHWVNSVMLRLAGITIDTPDPEGGVIERLPDGAPSGLLREAWLSLERALPAYDAEELAAAVRHFQRHTAARYGLTTVHEAGVLPGEPVLDAYEALQRRGELGVRLCLSLILDPGLPLDAQIEAAVEERARHTGPLVRTAAVKLFVDGVIESHTAYLSAQYADRPGDRGPLVWAPERLIEASVAAARAGFQLHYHAIGDAAVSLSLDAIAAARRAGGAGGRDIVTHLQLVDPRDYARFAALGVTAAVQPSWFAKDATYDAEIYVPYLGRERAAHQYPMKSLWEHGVMVAAASDYPVSPPPDPLLGIHCGVLRRDPRHPETSSELWPQEAVTVAQMIASYTINGAHANFLEGETGSLEPGKVADLVVLGDDILGLPAARIHQARVELTVFGGEPVFATGVFEGLAPA
jgi:predicted amidohydrolase YtcJ